MRNIAVFYFVLLMGCNSDLTNSTTSAPKTSTGPQAVKPYFTMEPADLMTSTGKTIPALVVRDLMYPLPEAIDEAIRASLSLHLHPEGDIVSTVAKTERLKISAGLGNIARIQLYPSVDLKDRWYKLRFNSSGLKEYFNPESTSSNAQLIAGDLYESRFATGSIPIMRRVSICRKDEKNATVGLAFSERVVFSSPANTLITIVNNKDTIPCQAVTEIPTTSPKGFNGVNQIAINCEVANRVGKMQVAISNQFTGINGNNVTTASGLQEPTVEAEIPLPGKECVTIDLL